MRTYLYGILIALLGIAIVLPLVSMVRESLLVDGQFSLSNYQAVFNGRRLGLLKTSLFVAFLATGTASLIAIPLAILFFRTDIPTRGLASIFCVLPLLLPPYLQAMSWILAMGDGGFLNSWLPDGFDLYNVFGVGWILGIYYFPVIFLFTQLALTYVSPAVEEAALLHKGPWRTLLRVTIPLCLPAIFAGVCLVFLLAMGNYEVPSLLTVNVFSIEVFSEFSAFYDVGMATALATPFLGMMTILLILMQVSFGRKRFVGNRYPTRRTMIHVQQYSWLFVAGVWFVLVVCIGFPFAVLLFKAASVKILTSALQIAGNELLFSLVLATAVGAGLSVLSYLIAWASLDEHSRLGRMLGAVSLLPLAIPPTILGIGYIRLFNRPGWMGVLYKSPVIMGVLQGVIALPITVLLMRVMVQRIPKEYREAAWTHGGSILRTHLFILIPLLKPAWMLVFVVGVIFSLGELSGTLLLYPPGMTTVSIRMFTIWHYGQEDLVAALGILVLAFTTILISLYFLLTEQRAPSLRGVK